MTSQNENLIIEILKKIQNDQTNTREALNSLVVRAGNMELELAHLDGRIAEQSVRIDNFSERLARVERRLEIIS